MTALALPVLASEEGLTRYLQAIRAFPLLSPEEEFMLGKRWREHGDVDAAHQLVTSHLRLVAKIAMGYRGYGLPLPDLISEGNIGLMQAVKRYEPDRGLRLSTYAMWWIKAAIQEYILASWSMVKLGSTAAHKKLFFNLGKLKRKLNIGDKPDLAPEEAAEIGRELSLSAKDVVDISRRLTRRDVSLNLPVGEEEESEWQDHLPEEGPSQETLLGDHEERSQRQNWLTAGLALLDPRERHIITERRLRDEPLTLEDLAGQYGVSRERIRQIENKAFAKLQRAVVQAAH